MPRPARAAELAAQRRQRDAHRVLECRTDRSPPSSGTNSRSTLPAAASSASSVVERARIRARSLRSARTASGLTKMLMTTRGAASLRRAPRDSCGPRCRLPIVGANATRFAGRAPPRPTDGTDGYGRRCAPTRTAVRGKSGPSALRVALLSANVCSSAGIAAILDGRARTRAALERRVAPRHEVLHEARHATLRDSEDVVDHENLAVDARTRADADHGHLHGVANCGADARSARTRAATTSAPAPSSARASSSIRCAACLLAPLHLEAADLVHGLRLQTEMRANRDVLAARDTRRLPTCPRPISSLTIIAPPSCMRRTALSSACAGVV